LNEKSIPPPKDEQWYKEAKVIPFTPKVIIFPYNKINLSKYFLSDSLISKGELL
jgi:hypothetical protein